MSSSLQTSAETDLENASSSGDEPRRKTGRGRRAAGQSLSAAALRKDNLTPVQRRRLRKLADENEAASGASSSQENAVSDDESTGRTRSARRKSTRASSSAPRATRTSRRKTSISEITSEAVSGIRFFPDGGSTGGHVELTVNDREYRVNVAWLTGETRLEKTGG